ncbi:tail fiber domain-containing protein [Kluyvera sp. Awk 3]|uniref:tail fiber domain-containing protein n=1 Tax=Kluyvera sp. Awk 3 TaxID=2963956 RepID=UPI0023027A69|nr:tail fiber domain-containing protein [Kluyvera sp. Awk 3]MDA8489638.1 tail fiber domain-containing protein [Kluyvera sp. Awk 3]
MSAGTISIQNNAAAVVGDGTVFTTELSAGDFIVITTGGVTYTLPVKSVESDTALTLARNYNGPAVTGAAWTAMPRDTLNRISAQIAADTAYAIRQRVLEIDNWYQLLEVNGNVTIKMADGSSYTGPSWLRLIDIMNALDIDQVTSIADQIRADAAQVAEDKPVIVQAKDDAEAAAVAAAASQKAAASSEAASASSETAAADSATAAAKSAEEAASHNPAEALVKTNNLSDLADREEAWLNVRPTGPTPLAADPIDDLDSATMGWVKTFIASVKSVITSWSVIISSATAPANNTTVKGGAVRSVFKVGNDEYASADFQVSSVNLGGVKTVSAEVVVKDATSGAATSKTIKLGTIDGLTGGLLTSAFGKANATPGSFDSLYTGNRNYGLYFEQMAVVGTGYLYPHISFKLYWPGNYGGAFTWSAWANTNSPEYVLSWTYEGGTTPNRWQFNGTNGNATATGSWNGGSDVRHKYGIELLRNPLEAVLSFRGATYHKKDGGEEVGLISQDVEKYCPQAISETSREFSDGRKIEDFKNLNTAGVAAAYSVEATKQLVKLMKLMLADPDAALKRIEELETYINDAPVEDFGGHE